MPLIFAQIGESSGTVFVPLQTGILWDFKIQDNSYSGGLFLSLFSNATHFLFIVNPNNVCPASVIEIVQKKLLPTLDLRKPGKKSHKFEKYVNCFLVFIEAQLILLVDIYRYLLSSLIDNGVLFLGKPIFRFTSLISTYLAFHSLKLSLMERRIAIWHRLLGFWKKWRMNGIPVIGVAARYASPCEKLNILLTILFTFINCFLLPCSVQTTRRWEILLGPNILKAVW